MTSANQINEVLSRLRGAPAATFEAYTRSLRQGGVLPATKRGRGAKPMTAEDAGMILLAVMRGANTKAAENAAELGALIAAEDSLDSFGNESIFSAKLQTLDWEDGITLKQAIGRVIGTFADAQEHELFATTSTLRLEVDRYFPAAALTFTPHPDKTSAYLEAWKAALPDAKQVWPWASLAGVLHNPIRLSFKHPSRHAIRTSFEAGETEENRSAHDAWHALIRQRTAFDLHGTEAITASTIGGLASLFRKTKGTGD